MPFESNETTQVTEQQPPKPNGQDDLASDEPTFAIPHLSSALRSLSQRLPSLHSLSAIEQHVETRLNGLLAKDDAEDDTGDETTQ